MIPHLSIGLEAGIGWASSASTSGTTASANAQVSSASIPGASGWGLRLGPRVGYDIPISNLVSFWPQVGIDFRHEVSSSDAEEYVGASGAASLTTTPTAFQNQLSFVAVAPIVIHPLKGFFIGAGPSFSTGLSNSLSESGVSTSIDQPKVTNLGVCALVGGAF